MPTSLGYYEAQPDDTVFGEVPNKWLFLSFTWITLFCQMYYKLFESSNCILYFVVFSEAETKWVLFLFPDKGK